MKKIAVVMLSLALLMFLVTSANAFPVTGKQIVEINSGGLDNTYQITITNPTNMSYVLTIRPAQQFYIDDKIPFAINENWLDKFKQYENWQEVEWIRVKEDIIYVSPNTIKKVNFVINTGNLTTGTFYGKLEVKDASEKTGTIVVRMVYVSQVVGYVEEPEMTVIPGFGFVSLMVCLLFLVLFMRWFKIQ
jgi:hypothetical protein